MSAERAHEKSKTMNLSVSGLAIVLIGVVMAGAFGTAAVAEDEPKLGVSPPRIEFGTVETTKTKSTKIKNNGKADLVVSSIDPCPGTTTEFSWVSPAPFTLAPKESLRLAVSYTPVDAGQDKGCFEIASNDPKHSTFEVALRGRGKDDAPPATGPDIDLTPSSLDFGEVVMGSSRALAVKVKNKGSDPLENVIFNRCFQTSDEYTWDPMSMFSVPPGGEVVVVVTYAPIDLGVDEGCLEAQSNDPDENPAVLEVTGAGVETSTAVVDLDIRDFKVKKKFQLGSADEIFVNLWVVNTGEVDEPRLAMVVGMQNGAVVYEQSLSVSDKGGNKGGRKYAFPSFLATEAGEILWMATILDDDPDIDEALAVTQVVGASQPSVDVDLDAVKMKPTKKVSLTRGKPVRLRVWVENPGSVDESRVATLSGVQGGVEVYSATLDVSDRPGDAAATKYNFPRFAPSAEGDILWTVSIADDDPDVDAMSAVTRVKR
jgi:hypothetical protein